MAAYSSLLPSLEVTAANALRETAAARARLAGLEEETGRLRQGRAGWEYRVGYLEERCRRLAEEYEQRLQGRLGGEVAQRQGEANRGRSEQDKFTGVEDIISGMRGEGGRGRSEEIDGAEEPDQNSVVLEIISEIRKRPGLHLDAGGQLQQGAQEVIQLDEEEEQEVQVGAGERESSILEEQVAVTDLSEEPLSFSEALEELDSWMDLELPSLI